MEEAINSSAAGRVAVVTGANKGIGFETCRQLAANGVMVVLTARDEKKGGEALEKLRGFGLSDNVVFHQLDVMDASSIVSLAGFIKTRFGKLDILVNNAGTGGVMLEGDVLKIKETVEESGYQVGAFGDTEHEQVHLKANGKLIVTPELAEECLRTNYYGPKRIIEAFIPLLQLSDSPTIVNVASFMGKLKLLTNEWAIAMLSDARSLTEETVDAVINKFLEDFGEGATKNWPLEVPAYKLSKAALNAYTRILAKMYPTFRINSVCPGYVRTDMTGNTGRLTTAEGAESVVKLVLLSSDGPTGLFFLRQEVSSF